MRAPVVLLLGPTATGKSALALAAAREVGAEIVSVDSAAVYRGLDIGTAKPDAAARARAPHHLLDIRDATQVYSAGEFRTDALRLIAQIHARGRLPLLVGGTLLYFRALEHGLAALPRADAAVRASLAREAAAHGWGALHARLRARDPAAAARIRPGDHQRILRALEVHALSGAPISAHHVRARAQPPLRERYRVLRLILAPPERAALHAAIEARVDAMLHAGLVAEVEALRARGLDETLPALRAVGYRQVLAGLRSGQPRAAMREAILAATRALARRQLTWLRGEPGGVWMNPYVPNVSRNLVALVGDAFRLVSPEGSP
jgi:tRNA dimethylallyltransferase